MENDESSLNLAACFNCSIWLSMLGDTSIDLFLGRDEWNCVIVLVFVQWQMFGGLGHQPGAMNNRYGQKFNSILLFFLVSNSIFELHDGQILDSWTGSIKGLFEKKSTSRSVCRSVSFLMANFWTLGETKTPPDVASILQRTWTVKCVSDHTFQWRCVTSRPLDRRWQWVGCSRFQFRFQSWFC